VGGPGAGPFGPPKSSLTSAILCPFIFRILAVYARMSKKLGNVVGNFVNSSKGRTIPIKKRRKQTANDSLIFRSISPLGRIREWEVSKQLPDRCNL